MRRADAAFACRTGGDYVIAMPVRLKKFIGTLILVALVIVYALVATIVAVAQLGESGPLVHLAYFFFTGLLWVIPAMFIVKWMATPPRGER